MASQGKAYCSNCGMAPGSSSECIDGYSRHRWVDTQYSVYCSNCGKTPGIPTKCLEGYSRHRWEETRTSVYCSNCGKSPSYSPSKCLENYSRHRWVEVQEKEDERSESIFEGVFKANLLTSVISNAIAQRQSDPDMIRAKRIYNAIMVITDAYNSGDRYGYMATLRLLKGNDFNHYQAKYILDLFLNKTDIMINYEEENGKKYIMINPDSETFKALNEGYANNIYTNIKFDNSQTLLEEHEDDDE